MTYDPFAVNENIDDFVEDEADDEFYEEDEFDDSYFDNDIHIKWIADGATTLSEVADRLRDYADSVVALEASGFQLRVPVDNSHGFVGPALPVNEETLPSN